MKRILTLAIVTLALTACNLGSMDGSSIQLVNGDNIPGTDQPSTPDDHLSNDGFTVELLSYQGQDNWNYSISGYKPTPCHTAEVEVFVAESFPEQVSFQVNLAPPTGDIMCAQILEEIVLDGSFQASEQAEVTGININYQ